MKNLILILSIIATSIHVNAQKCTVYIPGQVGTIVETYQYNKKDKLTSITQHELTDIKQKGDTTIYYIRFSSTDDKGKNPTTNEFVYKCYKDIFFIDMNVFINEEQMQAYEDMEMEVSVQEVNLPANLSAGQRLNDGSISIKILGLPIAMSMNINVENRKVEAIEDLETPSGKFSCALITEDVVTKMGMTFKFENKTWYSENVGAVRTESYRNGKLMSYSVINKVTK